MDSNASGMCAWEQLVGLAKGSTVHVDLSADCLFWTPGWTRLRCGGSFTVALLQQCLLGMSSRHFSVEHP